MLSLSVSHYTDRPNKDFDISDGTVFRQAIMIGGMRGFL
ncbi:MAG: hypothetical protein CM1200mP29_03300 [Verrucomicrobiota bacterium]|nr:MAG: hypothetical protein CM1200mP29_03300 [Verrucomicrobiota bacterium]